MKTKLTKTSFTIFPLSIKKLCNKPHFGQKARDRDKTLTNSKEAYKKVAPLERTFHKEPNKNLVWNF